jgi:hypothetical protein
MAFRPALEVKNCTVRSLLVAWFWSAAQAKTLRRIRFILRASTAAFCDGLTGDFLAFFRVGILTDGGKRLVRP